MATPVQRSVASNKHVGVEIGLDHTTVSRIRNGQRHPSWSIMRNIKSTYGWSVEDQVAAREAGTYADEFERRLKETHG